MEKREQYMELFTDYFILRRIYTVLKQGSVLDTVTRVQAERPRIWGSIPER
jgi:hypothetical protein